MELAILSARIFTGDPKKRWAQGLLIQDKRIVEVGSNQEIRTICRNSGTHVLEMPGRLITPGLVDAHCHFGYYGRSLLTIDLSHQPSLTACRQRIRESLTTYKPGEWIIGQGWNEHQWEDAREPTFEDLDDLTPDNPALMFRACGHTVWINSPAMAEAGITRDTIDPPGGRIERDPNTGEPTGLIREARHLIERVMPPTTQEEWKKAILASQEASLRVGLTGVHSFETLEQWEATRALEVEGKLKIRIHHSIQGHELKKALAKEIKPGYGSDRLWIGHIKLYADGTLGSGTALLHEPYNDDTLNLGIAVNSVGELKEKIELAYREGYDVAIHSIGDKATTNCLQAITAAREKFPGKRRDRIEHLQLLRSQDISLFKELGIVASVQPVFLPTDWSVADKRWGPHRCRSGGYAWRTILEAGIPMQFGSDSPIEPNDPVLGFCAAVTRQTLQGEPPGGWFPEEKLSLEESINSFTQISAWSARKESILGTLTPGKLADLTIFETDLFRVPAASWPSVAVEMTIVGGEVVYQK